MQTLMINRRFSADDGVNISPNFESKSPIDLLSGLNDLIVPNEQFENCLNLIKKTKIGWKFLADSILIQDSVQRKIFLQELQKRRKLKAKANILKQDSIRSMGRRGGWAKPSGSSPFDVYKIFEQAKNSLKNRKVNPFCKDSYFKSMVDDKLSQYNFQQTSNKNIDRDNLLKFKSRKLTEITSKLRCLKRDSNALLDCVKCDNKNLKRFMRRSWLLNKNFDCVNHSRIKSRYSLYSTDGASSVRSCCTQRKETKMKKKIRINPIKSQSAISTRDLRGSKFTVYCRPGSDKRPKVDNFILKINSRHIKPNSKQNSCIISSKIKLKLHPSVKKSVKNRY